jgi:hypothetical protein
MYVRVRVREDLRAEKQPREPQERCRLLLRAAGPRLQWRIALLLQQRSFVRSASHRRRASRQ